MHTLKNPKTVALVSTALFIACLFWLMSTKSVNSALESNLETEKLKSESLLSEKLLLEKDLEQMKVQLSGLKGINSELDHLVNAAQSRFAAQEMEMKKLRKQNMSLAEVKRQREALARVQRELEDQLFALQTSYTGLQTENGRLQAVVANLEEQNKLLAQDLNRAMFAAVDHAQVQAVKGKKERLTVKAKRTQKLIADFEVPASLRNISYRITDSNGNLLSEKHGTIVSTALTNESNVLVSASGSSGNGLQKMRMTYTPKTRMAPGTYRVEILNDNLYVESMNVRLR